MSAIGDNPIQEPKHDLLALRVRGREIGGTTRPIRREAVARPSRLRRDAASAVPRTLDGPQGGGWCGVVSVLAVVAVAAGLVVAVPAPSLAQSSRFADVAEGSFYSEAVVELDRAGVFAGTECGEGFCPADVIDRKTMAVWVVRVLDATDPAPVTESRFDDVDASGFHAPFVERMADLEVSMGCGDGSGFCPDRDVSRAQMAVFLSRAYSLPDGPDPGLGDVPLDAWYAEEVAKLAASKITVGCGDGTVFCPGRPTTRGQMATFLHRAENRNLDDSAGVASGLSPAMDGGGLIATGWCAIKTDNTLICWDIATGSPDADTPAGTFTAVSGYGGDYGGHHCAIRTDRTITCWGGGNHDGQADAPAGQFIAVSANGDFSCAVGTDRTITCWGSASRGRTDAPEGRFTAVSGACALRTDRTIACWGDYGDPPSGQFTSVSGECAIRIDGTIACWYDPLYEDDPQLANEEKPPSGQFTAISNYTSTGGRDFNYCAIRSDGTMACWGVNFHGAAFAQPGQFLAVAVGGDHSCAIGTDGALICWGRSDTDLRMPPGQTIRADDQPTHSVQPGGETLSVGQTHTCGVLADGNVSCWGNHQNGRQAFPSGGYLAVSAGRGHSCGLLADQTITCPGTHFPRSATAPAGHFLAVSAGGFHSCGLLTNLTIHCWGQNDDGQLDAPTGRFLAVSAGSSHSCGLRTDQTVTCWGNNGQGRSDAPAGQFAAVSAGSSHSCGLRTDQTVTCWGYNEHGQSDAPGGQFAAVSAGGTHSCGLRTDQTVTCWGNNGQGRSDAPGGQFAAVSAGGYLSCGLRTDQTVTCWGSDSYVFAAAPPQLRFLDKSDATPSASVLLPRSADCRQPTSGAGAPGPPAGVQIVRLDSVDAWGSPTRPPTVGWTSPCSGGSVDHYIVQWRRGHEDFDSARQQIVQSAASTEAYSAEIGGRRAYEIRVTAVNSNGQSRYAQMIVPTPSQRGLRTIGEGGTHLRGPLPVVERSLGPHQQPKLRCRQLGQLPGL